MTRKPIMFAVRLSVAALFGLAAAVGLILWHALLNSARGGLQSEREIRFSVRPFSPMVNSGFEAVSAPAVFTQVARFENNLYIAGPSGLQVYEPSGDYVRTYEVGRELPGSALVAIAPAVLADSKQPELAPIRSLRSTGLHDIEWVSGRDHQRQTQRMATFTLRSSMMQASISGALRDLTDMGSAPHGNGTRLWSTNASFG
jgi:hypothetical protein